MVAPTSSLDYTEIPVIDWQLSETDKPTFLRQLRDAMINIGFLYLGNHPVPKEVIEEVKRVAPTVFDLPQEIKDSIDMSNCEHFHGYLKWDGSNVKDSKDVREQFNFGGDRVCEWKEGEPEYLKLHGSALWPTEEQLPGFKEVMLRYYKHVEDMSFKFTQLVSESLGLKPDELDQFFDEDHEKLQPRCKILRYPGSTNEQPGSGIGAHVDGSFLTYLLQVTDHRTLEVKNLSGEWIRVPPKEGTFVINLGRTLEKVTQRVLPATPHRVISPTGPPRFSVAFFSSVGLDVRLADAVKLKFPQEVLDMKAARDRKLGDESEFQFVEKDYQLAGEVVLARKLRSHADIAEKFYPSLFPKIYPNGPPEKKKMGKKGYQG
ncbi:Clavaminate synthase-like protein [Dendrothele bispora CBS 962.96]|uniref:Clavaminate synthase-like protein n=1 Tax=Dendrothele bispora (strain CBS 962.96) TaxID=1314807 RepID=A0A4S8M4P6_DENBC|nr:Clavaminate synthase-like protein [Dendrothele bispora CBS 962.96]